MKIYCASTDMYVSQKHTGMVVMLCLETLLVADLIVLS